MFSIFASLEDPEFGLTELFDRTVLPTIVSRTGDETVVRAGLDPRDESGAGLSETSRGTIEITLGKDSRPLRSVVEEMIETEGEDDFPGIRIDARLEVEYSGWGEPVTVEAPSDAEIDRTPWVEEEAIAGFLDVPLLQPRGIPEGWVLDYADVLPADEFDGACDQVEIDYISPDDEFGYLYLYQSDIDCADTEAPSESEPFVAGSNRGWIEADAEYGYTFAQIVVGRTVIEADTDLSPEALARVLSQLRTLDFTVEPDPIPGLESGFGTPS